MVEGCGRCAADLLRRRADGAAALSNVLANEDYDIPEAYVFQNDNVSQAGKITYYPVDMLMFVEKQAQGGDLIDTIDLGPLQSNDDRS